MSDLTAFTAGAFTLSGWVTDFTNAALHPHYQITDNLSINSFVFNTGSLDTKGYNGGIVSSESPQQISITQTATPPGSTDTVSLALSFNGTQTGLYLANGTGAGNDLLDASSSGTLVLGGTAGESASQLISQLLSLQVKDSNSGHDTFSISFTLDDIRSGSVVDQTSFREFFVTACFTPGTRIATQAGEVAVENLQIGDLVSTASGEQPVKWIGRRGYSAAAVAEFANLRPVLIREGALAPGLPRRDLMVSPMHALLIDDVFIPVAALVNGVSILRRQEAGPAEYVHIELDTHNVVFAEGAPAESFADDNTRALFDNASEYYDLYGADQSPGAFCAPRLEEGYRLEAVRHRLATRAGVAIAPSVPGGLSGHVERLADGVLEGWVMDPANPAMPVELEVLADGEIVATLLANRYRVDLDHAGLAAGRCGFTLAMPASVTLARVEVRRAADGRAVAMPRPVRQFALAY